jgi:hypothetical protein
MKHLSVARALTRFFSIEEALCRHRHSGSHGLSAQKIPGGQARSRAWTSPPTEMRLRQNF